MKNTTLALVLFSIAVWLFIAIAILIKSAMGVYDSPPVIDGSFLVVIPVIKLAYLWEKGGRIQREAGLIK